MRWFRMLHCARLRLGLRFSERAIGVLPAFSEPESRTHEDLR
jgi:hypothetical protein